MTEINIIIGGQECPLSSLAGHAGEEVVAYLGDDIITTSSPSQNVRSLKIGRMRNSVSGL